MNLYKEQHKVYSGVDLHSRTLYLCVVGQNRPSSDGSGTMFWGQLRGAKTMRFVRPREVLEMIGVSRTTLWRMVTRGAFPPPVWISAGARGFRLEEVERWMAERSHHSPLAMPAAPSLPATAAGGDP